MKEFGVALRVERLVRLFSVEPGNEGAYAILLPMPYQIRLMAVPSRSSQTDSPDMRSLTHPH